MTNYKFDKDKNDDVIKEITMQVLEAKQKRRKILDEVRKRRRLIMKAKRS